MLLLFIKSGYPLFLHLTTLFYLAYIHKLNTLEFLGLNFSLGFTIHFLDKLLRLIYDAWLGVILGHNTDLTKMGSWAVVTGATDGIGLAYSRQLAKRGLNIVLMSRTLDRLEKCAKTLESEFHIKTKVIAVDFCGDIDIYDKIEEELSQLDIGTLINNVGMTYDTPSHFHHIKDSKKYIHDMININILAVTMMTRAVLPQMLEKGKGVIVNVGSIVSLIHAPWFTLYAANKAYMDKFTQDLANEYKDTGIIFQYLLPGYVATKLSKIRNASLWIPSPERYAEMAVNSIGLQERSAVWLPHRALNVIHGWTTLFLPKATKEIFRCVMKSFWIFGAKRQMQKNGIKLTVKL